MRFHFSSAFTLASEPLFPISNALTPGYRVIYIARIYMMRSCKCETNWQYFQTKMDVLFFFSPNLINNTIYSVVILIIFFSSVRCAVSFQIYPLSILIGLRDGRVELQSSVKNNTDKA